MSWVYNLFIYSSANEDNGNADRCAPVDAFTYLFICLIIRMLAGPSIGRIANCSIYLFMWPFDRVVALLSSARLAVGLFIYSFERLVRFANDMRHNQWHVRPFIYLFDRRLL